MLPNSHNNNIALNLYYFANSNKVLCGCVATHSVVRVEGLHPAFKIQLHVFMPHHAIVRPLTFRKVQRAKCLNVIYFSRIGITVPTIIQIISLLIYVSL